MTLLDISHKKYTFAQTSSMKSHVTLLLTLFCILLQSGCKQVTAEPVNAEKNAIRYAEGLSIARYEGYSIVKVNNPWPAANKIYTYILHKKNATVPDSLRDFPAIAIPVKNIIVTSTTHIPSLEMLGVESTLKGFPNLTYISSPAMRALIESGKIRELGSNLNLNTEVVLDMQPDVIMGYGIDNNNPSLDNLQKSGLKVILNGDWNEQSPLGKAEWLKLFGELYDKQSLADSIFNRIESNYNNTVELVKKAGHRPTVLAGAMYQDQWYLPQGNSWGASFISQAGGLYLWQESAGTGSLSLPFETVLEKAGEADFWIGPGQFTSLKEMAANNTHYRMFKAYQTGNVFSFSSKKGKTGGVIYFEIAPNRPDLVLEDIAKILHPELFKEHTLTFFEKLK
jgi:iron complex transport system substrate-binding protein